MSTTSMLTSNSLTVKRWSMQAFIDMYKNTAFGRMMSRGTIYKADELNNANRGDNVTFSFTGILTGTGTGEGGTLVGNEEALDLNSDTLVVNVFRHAVNNPNDGTIEQQRTNVRFEQQARTLLPKFHSARLDASVFNQLAGVDSTTITADTTVYSGTDKLFVQGLNSVTAPSSSRIVRAGGAASDEALTSSDTFTLDLIDAALELARTTYPTIEPLDGDEFDLFISPQQEVDLKRDATGKIQWYTNELAMITGGKTDDNYITKGSIPGIKPIGKYANVNIIPSFRVAAGENSATSAAIPTVKRAVLCGRNAAVYGSPMGGTLKDQDVPFRFYTQFQDYDYFKGIEARMLYGLKKLRFSGGTGAVQDFGSIVISTFAGSHTS